MASLTCATTRSRFSTATTETVDVGFVLPAVTGAAARGRTDCRMKL